MNIQVLLIDDDRFIHKVVKRAIEPEGFGLACASDGEEGLGMALDQVPEVILLDVEMPGTNGYEVCTQLRENPVTEHVPVVFLSSKSTLRERLQGYEVGADDYLTKPFEAENLVARLKVLGKYRQDRQELHAQYKLAQETAITAMTGTSDFGHAVRYMEKILTYQTVEETINGLLEIIDHLNIDVVLHLKESVGEQWYSTDGAISPLEKELVESSGEQRFLDFGCRTLINFDPLFMLVRNMPLDDMERYGRLKDLMPVLLSATDTKLNSIRTQQALVSQGSDLKQSFSFIRRNLFDVAKSMVDRRKQSFQIGNRVIEKLTMDMISMGLDEEQEVYIIERLDESFAELLDAMDSGPMLKESLSFILQNLQSTVTQHSELLEAYLASQQRKIEIDEVDDDGVELF
ncbi:MAG: PleD family two-component system response regulator [Pseudomonadales bacterium]